MMADELYKDSVELLKQLIATPSFSKEEDKSADIIEAFLKSNNVDACRFLNNVWARNKFFDEAKPTILLNSHHDTVKPNKGYTLDPSQTFERDGKLFGLGSNDAGGPLVSQVLCFLYYHSKPGLKYNLVIAATAEEETVPGNGV